MIHPIIEAQLEKLREAAPGAEARAAADGQVLISVPKVALEPAGRWNRPWTRIWFLAPLGYPQARPDCFWTEADVRLAGGGMPTNTRPQPIPGENEPRLWFSWHVSTWNPNQDDLVTYLKVIALRLQDPR